MTDPVFALEPDVPRNVRLARWLLFRLLSGLREGSLTVREGAQTFHFGDPAAALRAEARVCTPEVYWRLLTGGSLAAAEALDGRRLGEPPADGAAADPRAQRQGAGASGARLSSAGQARRPPAPLDPPQHPRPRRGRTSPPITTSATNFTPTFWMRTCSTPARCLPMTSRI